MSRVISFYEKARLAEKNKIEKTNSPVVVLSKNKQSWFIFVFSFSSWLTSFKVDPYLKQYKVTFISIKQFNKIHLPLQRVIKVKVIHLFLKTMRKEQSLKTVLLLFFNSYLTEKVIKHYR